MSKRFSQKQIGDFLSANPLGAPVHVGDLANMNGNDYIFLDYLNDTIIPNDNQGCYKTTIQISIYTKNFLNRRKLVNYVKGLTQFDIAFQGSDDGNYFVSILQSEIFLNE